MWLEPYRRAIRLTLYAAIFLPLVSFAQKTTVQGKVTEAGTDSPVPFANVRFSGTVIGVTTDFDGYYTLSTDRVVDSVTVSYVGYLTVHIPITPHTGQEVDIKLEPSVVNLGEVVVHAGKYENPAYAIIRNVLKHKKQNDKRFLNAYEYESYSKIELGINNLTDAMRKQKFIQRILSALDTIRYETDKESAHLPVFFSETLSKYYYRDNPNLEKEHVLKTNASGIGIESSGVLSELLGTSILDYNFYRNRLPFFEKNMISPIASDWKMYYEYELLDSMYLGTDYCYRIRVFPRREQDLAFYGLIWITKEGYALKQLDLNIQKSANLNFVEDIHFQQQLMETPAGPWLPEKIRMVFAFRPVQFRDITFLSTFNASVQNPVVNRPRPPQFYRQRLQVADDAQLQPKGFWDSQRHDTLTTAETQVLKMFEVVNADPATRRTVRVLKALGTGYYRVGKIEVGPYPLLYLYNDVEESRISLGLRTNKYFSRKVRLSALGGYGTGDREFKYHFTVDYVISPERWSVLSATVEKEIEQVGLDPDLVGSNYIFYTASKWGTFDNPYYYRNKSISFRIDLWKGGGMSFWLRSKGFEPLYPFSFTWHPDAMDPEAPGFRSFQTTEAGISLRLSKDEDFVTTNFDRISLGDSDWPVVTLGYAYGISGFLGGDFNYHKVSFGVSQRINVRPLGVSNYSIAAGKLFNPLPYPLLRVHTGNESLFYTTAAFSQMNYMEFVSDRYASFRFLHNFNGFILNRIPLVRKLKWRLLAEANVLFGSLSDENLKLLQASAIDNSLVANLGALSGKPYIEVGYGIENIFRFIRVDVFHRLTYLSRPDINKVGVKISAQLEF